MLNLCCFQQTNWKSLAIKPLNKICLFQDRRYPKGRRTKAGGSKPGSCHRDKSKLSFIRVFIEDLLSDRPVLVAKGDTEAKQGSCLEEILLVLGHMR